ncbi:MAG: DUF3370 family protein [Coleofasciculaceae cyanobacterium]
MIAFLNLSMQSSLSFPDIQSHWAKDCISQMAVRNLVRGYPDGSFRPQSTITRAEFAVLMLNAFPQAAIKRPGISFQDVSTQHWAYQAIQDAYRREFFSGYPGRIFRPNQPIPRVQAIAILAGAVNFSPPANQAEQLKLYFDDAALIPSYAQGAVAAAAIGSLVVNYPNVKQLRPNQAATRGEVTTLLCRALNIYSVPPQYIAGVTISPGEVRTLPGKLDRVPVFNSNSPELIETEGILLSTFPPEGKQVEESHLNFAFLGRFDIFSHHISRAETQEQTRPLYQGLLVHNPNQQAVTLEILQAASYLSTPEAPFIPLPDLVNNPRGTVYSGPGSRTMNDVLRGIRQANFPEKLLIEPGESQMLLNQPIPIERAPASNGRSTLMRLHSDYPVYLANLALKAPRQSNGGYRQPSLNEWQKLLKTGELAQPRGKTPTPLDPPREPTVFGRVAGVSQGSQWQTVITDSSKSEDLTIPPPDQAFSYVLATLHLITLATGQVQSAPMLKRYPDTAYFAHSNYGVEYHLTLPLKNSTDQVQTVTISLQTPLKDEASRGQLLFLQPRVEQVFFRGTVKLFYEDEQGQSQTRYLHLVQRRGQPGEPLVQINLPPGTRKEILVNFIYPPDSTPPQVLTISTLAKPELISNLRE